MHAISLAAFVQVPASYKGPGRLAGLLPTSEHRPPHALPQFTCIATLRAHATKNIHDCRYHNDIDSAQMSTQTAGGRLGVCMHLLWQPCYRGHWRAVPGEWK